MEAHSRNAISLSVSKELYAFSTINFTTIFNADATSRPCLATWFRNWFMYRRFQMSSGKFKFQNDYYQKLSPEDYLFLLAFELAESGNPNNLAKLRPVSDNLRKEFYDQNNSRHRDFYNKRKREDFED